MNHIEAGFKGKNALWRYIIMFAVVLIVANSIGSAPLLIALFSKSANNPAVVSQFARDPGNLGLLGVNMNIGLAIMLIPFLTGLIAFMLLVKPLHGRTVMQTINGGAPFRWKRYFISALVWASLSALYLYGYLKLDPSNFSLNNISSSIAGLVVISLILIPFQAALEEILFRAYLMQGFAVLAKNRWIPLLITSTFFGLLHAFNPEVDQWGFLTMMPQYITFGLIFGIITLLDDGVEAAMGAHAANNAFLCIMVTNESSSLQTAAIYKQLAVHPWTEYAGLIITGVVFILVLKVIFRWKDAGLLYRKVLKPVSDAVN